MPKTKKSDLALFVRIGDGGEYENHGHDFSSLVDNLYEHCIKAEEIDWLICPRNPEADAKKHNSPYLASAGFRTPSFDGNDYVSLYWGDKEGDLIQPLTKEEEKEVVRLLKKVEKENTGYFPSKG